MNFIRIVKFDIKNILRNPMLVLMNTLLPLLMIGIMGLTTSESFGAGGVSSYDYNGVTMMIFTALLISGTATNTFMEEKVKKGNTRIIYAPIPKAQIYLSKLLSTYIVGVIFYSIILIAGQFLFHINFGAKNIGYIIIAY